MKRLQFHCLSPILLPVFHIFTFKINSTLEDFCHSEAARWQVTFLCKCLTLQELVLIQKLYFKIPALISSSVLTGVFAGVFTEFILEKLEVLLSIRKDFLVDKVIFFPRHQGTGLRSGA